MSLLEDSSMISTQSLRSRRPLGGFTLLELIVVLIVLGILSALAIPTFNKVKTNARITIVTTSAQALVREAKAIYAQRGTGTGTIDKAAIEKAAEDSPTAIPDATVPNETKFTYTNGDQSASVSVVDGSITIATVSTASTTMFEADLTNARLDDRLPGVASWSASYPVLYYSKELYPGYNDIWYLYVSVATAQAYSSPCPRNGAIAAGMTSTTIYLKQTSSSPTVSGGAPLVSSIFSCTYP